MAGKSIRNKISLHERLKGSLRGTSKAPGTVFLLVLSPACVPTGLMW
jgi:hypothetical protein